MGKYKKNILYGAIGLLLMLFIIRFFYNTRYRSGIPEISNFNTISQPVKEQIAGALEKARRNPSADNLGMLGMIYHSSSNYLEAEKCYNLAIQRKKSDWIWNYYLGHLNMEMGESEKVIENFNRVIEINPDIGLAWYYLGEEYNNLGKNDLAEEAFSKISAFRNGTHVSKTATRIDYFPLSTYAKFQLSRIYFETGKYDAAEKTLKGIIEDTPSFGPAYRLIGNVFSINGDSLMSKRYGARANDLLAFSPPVDTLVDKLVLLSRSELYVLKKIDEAKNSVYSDWALRLVNNAMQYLPDNKYLISKAIEINLWMNIDTQVISLIDKHISVYQDNHTELKKIGMMFFLNGLYPQSVKYFTRVLELEPDDPEVHENLAISYWYLGDKSRSREIFNALEEKHRKDPDVLADIANIYFFNFKESDRANGYLTKLKQISPDHPKVLKLSAGIAEKNGYSREAIALYESSFKADPEDLSTIQYLGNLLRKEELWKKSIEHYRKALEYHPNEPDFLEWLGSILLVCPDSSLRNIEEGKYYAERAFHHISSRPNIQVSAGRSLAYAYAMLEEKKNAMSVINQTINIARRENISRTYQTELENLYLFIQSMKE
jgi:tetratricopeptide (TPR) repeat protein